MKAVHRFLLRHTIYTRVVKWAKKTRIPMFKAQSVFDVVSFLIQEFEKQSLHSQATSLSYNFLLAIFPGIIFLFTLIPYVPVSGFQDYLMLMLSIVLPQTAFLAVKETLMDLINNQRGGLLSFGFISAMFFATNGTHALMSGFNHSAFYRERRTWLRQRWVAIKLTLLIVFCLVFTIAALVTSEYFIDLFKSDLSIKNGLFLSDLMQYSRWFVFVVFYWFTVSVLYRYAPSIDTRWPIVSLGSLVATLLAVVTTVGFTYYINNFGTYNKIYGSIGTLMVIMLWLYFNSLILLVGFELNAKYFHQKKILRRRVMNRLNRPQNTVRKGFE